MTWTKRNAPGAIRTEALAQRNVVELIHGVLSSEDLLGGVVLDATAGNGHDTAFLAQEVGAAGLAIAVDLAEEALQATRALIESLGLMGRVRLVLGDHRELAVLVPEIQERLLRAAVFNLGYHPGGDRTHATSSASTVPALDAALLGLCPGALVCVAAYTGHPEGRAEADAVLEWAKGAAAQGLADARIIRDAGYELESRPEVFILRRI